MIDPIVKLLDKCYRYLKFRPRSEFEMRQYLQKKKKGKYCDEIVEILKKEGHIDDKGFVKWWIQQRNYFNPRGVILIKKELLQKGVNKGLINDFLAENKVDELEGAKKALLKKRKALDSQEYQKRKEKALQFLSRRGFSYSISKKAFEDLCSIE